jgi:hypothetical protein
MLCDDPLFMLNRYLSSSIVSFRKLRLLACAIMRHTGNGLLSDEIAHVESVAESGQWSQYHGEYRTDLSSNAAFYTAQSVCLAGWGTAYMSEEWSADRAWDCESYKKQLAKTQRFKADLVRATINPFNTPIPAEVRTPLVVRLATAAYEERLETGRECDRCIEGEQQWGQRCGHCGGTGRIDDGTLDPQRLAVLHDALLEAGLPEAVEVTCQQCQGSGYRYDEIGVEHRCFACSPGAVSWQQRGSGKVRIPNPLLATLREQTPRYRGFWALDQILEKE